MAQIPEFKWDDFSPQVQRLLTLAAVEASAGRNQRGDRVCEEHLLVAMAQVGEGTIGDLMAACGFTVADMRAGAVQPKPPKP
jgi:hypothetical protein